MIEFKIIACPDRSQQATYQHVGSQLTFGKQDGDMLVDDPAFGPLQLKVVVESDRAANIENLHSQTEVRLNGKPITGAVPLKEKDNVTIARTTINFSRLDLSPLPAPDPYEPPNAKERFTDGTKESTLLEVLAYLEKAASQGAPSPPLPSGAKGPLGGPPLPGSGKAPPPIPKKH